MWTEFVGSLKKKCKNTQKVKKKNIVKQTLKRDVPVNDFGMRPISCNFLPRILHMESNSESRGGKFLHKPIISFCVSRTTSYSSLCSFVNLPSIGHVLVMSLE